MSIDECPTRAGEARLSGFRMSNSTVRGTVAFSEMLPVSRISAGPGRTTYSASAGQLSPSKPHSQAAPRTPLESP